MAILNLEIISITAVVGYVVYVAYLSIYRLYLCPIAKFPGPRLAALTFWYEFYYDVFLRGQYEFEIAKMHKMYGPIVRINPYELHIKDSDYVDMLYPNAGSIGSSKKVDKWPWAMKMFGSSSSAFATSGHNLHRMRRSGIAPLFSKKAVYGLEQIIQFYVDKLLDRLTALSGSCTPVNCFDAYACLTGDIITDYSFGKPTGFLDSPDFSPKWYKLICDFGTESHICKHFGWYFPLLQSLPTPMAVAINPALTESVKVIRGMGNQIEEARRQKNSEANGDVKGPAHRTVFHEIFDSQLPEAEKGTVRLTEEGFDIVTAGTVTTADTLSFITYYLLKKPDIRNRLQNELRSIPASNSNRKNAKLEELEQLSYLTAIIKEGLRHSHGVAGRTSRIHQDQDLQYNQWTIPRGTPVSMSTWMTHTDPSKFPEPHEFKPERWLADQEAGQERLDKYMLAFGRGTRICVGMNLAMAELYMVVAAVFTPGNINLEVFETDESDLEMVRDSFMPGRREDSKGVRVLVV